MSSTLNLVGISWIVDGLPKKLACVSPVTFNKIDVKIMLVEQQVPENILTSIGKFTIDFYDCGYPTSESESLNLSNWSKNSSSVDLGTRLIAVEFLKREQTISKSLGMTSQTNTLFIESLRWHVLKSGSKL